MKCGINRFQCARRLANCHSDDRELGHPLPVTRHRFPEIRGQRNHCGLSHWKGTRISGGSFRKGLHRVNHQNDHHSHNQPDDWGSRPTTMDYGSGIVPSAVASLTQRIGEPVSSYSLPTAEVDSANKESVTSNASFSNFAKRIKFGQKATDRLPSQPEKSTDAKEPTDRRADESKKMDATDNATGAGRFGKFSMSLGGSIFGRRHTDGCAKY